MQLSPDRDRPEAYVPEDVEVCDVWGSRELLVQLHAITRDLLWSLCEMQKALKHEEAIALPFSALMPQEHGQAVNALEYQYLLRRHCEEEKPLLHRQLVGAVLGRRLYSRRRKLVAFDVDVLAVSPYVDQEEMVREMLSQTKDLLMDLECDVIRMILPEDAEDREEQGRWLWAQGFLPSRTRAEVQLWRPPHEGTYEQRLPPEQEV